jgi:hypothetical protein
MKCPCCGCELEVLIKAVARPTGPSRAAWEGETVTQTDLDKVAKAVREHEVANPELVMKRSQYRDFWEGKGKWIAYENQQPPPNLECEFKRDESRSPWLGYKVVRGKSKDFDPAFNVSGLLWRPVEIKYDDGA